MALSDIFDTSVVEVGKVKIGGLGDERTAQSGRKWRPPVKLDHFVITTLHRDEKGLLVPDTGLMESLAEYADKDGKLRSLPVMFLSNNVEDVFQSGYVWYVGKNLGARSDGRTVTFYFDPTTGKPLPEPRVLPWSKQFLDHPDPAARNRKLFKLFSTLNVVIATGTARWGGVYKFRTTGQISGRQLYDSLSLLHRLSGGMLRGPLFRLVVRPMTVSPEGKTTTVYVAHVEYISNDPKALLTQAREQRTFELASMEAVVQAERQYKALLAAPAADDPDDDLVPEEPAALPAKTASVEDLLGADIDAAETLDALKDLWAAAGEEKKAGRLAHDVYDRLAKRKDARKAALQPAAPTPAPPPAPAPAGGIAAFGTAATAGPDDEPEDEEDRPTTTVEPAPAGVPAPAPTAEAAPANAPAAPVKAGKAIVDSILRMCVTLGGSWEDARAAHAEELGITAGRAADLTPDQARRLHDALKAAVAARAEPQPA